MSEFKTRIRFKINELEIECEGQEIFLINELPNICATLTNHFKDFDFRSPYNSDLPKRENVSLSEINSVIDRSVSSIASTMKAKTGPELIMAAAAYLTFAKRKETFSRQEVHEEMKTAKSHYKKSMGSNLASNIANLVKNRRLNESANGEYALVAEEKVTLENLLA